ncbi:zinc ribbon domain-containing protein [Candidatus Woesearchaeota archaeon]|nr:zinc ribbon domain-containing protein [Candidatus Woesearchaeota archaeon]
MNCEKCGNEPYEGDIFCRKCGDDIDDDMKCECGAEVMEEDNFCHQCGSAFSGVEESSEEEEGDHEDDDHTEEEKVAVL